MSIGACMNVGGGSGRVLAVASCVLLAACGGTVPPVEDPEPRASAAAPSTSPPASVAPPAPIADEVAATESWTELPDTRWGRIIEPPKVTHRFFALPNQSGGVRVWIDCLSPGPSAFLITMRAGEKVISQAGECGGEAGYDVSGGFSLDAQAAAGGVVEVEVTGDRGALMSRIEGRERFAILVQSGGQPQDAVGRKRR